MTIDSQANVVSQVADGVTTAFAYPHKFLADEDLAVVLVTQATDAVVLQTIVAHYTVAGAGDALGGTVNFVTAPPLGVAVEIWPFRAMIQGRNFTTGGKLNLDQLEQAYDELTVMVQQLAVMMDQTAFDRSEADKLGLNPGFRNQWGARSWRIKNLKDPLDAQDAATQAHVQNAIAAGAVGSAQASYGRIGLAAASAPLTMASGVAVIMPGTWALDANNNQVDMPSNGRLRYIGATPKVFKLTAHGTLSLDAAVEYQIIPYLNGVALAANEGRNVVDYPTIDEQVDWHSNEVLVELNNGDYLEIFIEVDGTPDLIAGFSSILLEGVEQQGFVAEDAGLPDPALLANGTIVNVHGNAYVTEAPAANGDMYRRNDLVDGDAEFFTPNWNPVVDIHTRVSTVGNPLTDIDFFPNVFTGGRKVGSLDGTKLVECPALLTKEIDNAWVEGDGGGMIGAPVAADTDYHMNVIEKNIDGTIDYCFSGSLNSGAPTDWTFIRRVASFKSNASSQIPVYIQDIHDPDIFRLATPVQDEAQNDPTTARQLVEISCPPHVMADLTFSVQDLTPASVTYAWIREVAQLDAVPSISVHDLIIDGTAADPAQASIRQHMKVGAGGSMIGYRLNASTVDHNAYITVHGWIDKRSKH